MHFLNLEDVLHIHENQIANYGGASGIRDMELLQSAIGTPMATFGGQYLNSTIFEMAAAYLIQIVNNHPFIDGNKRSGSAVAAGFLFLNGYVIVAPEDTLADFVLLVAQSKADKTDAVIFFREWVRKKDEA